MDLELEINVTLKLTGREAHDLAVFLYENNANKLSCASAPFQVWSQLSELPEDTP